MEGDGTLRIGQKYVDSTFGLGLFLKFCARTLGSNEAKSTALNNILDYVHAKPSNSHLQIFLFLSLESRTILKYYLIVTHQYCLLIKFISAISWLLGCSADQIVIF